MVVDFPALRRHLLQVDALDIFAGVKGLAIGLARFKDRENGGMLHRRLRARAGQQPLFGLRVPALHLLGEQGHANGARHGGLQRQIDRTPLALADLADQLVFANDLIRQRIARGGRLLHGFGGIGGRRDAESRIRFQNGLKRFKDNRVFIDKKDFHWGRSEAGKVAGFYQPQKIGGLAYGSFVPEQWANATRAVDFFDVKGDLERVLDPLHFVTEALQHPALHPGRSAKIFLTTAKNRIEVGFIGELHPGLQQAYELPQAPVLFELDLDPIRELGLPVPEELSKFPAVQRDLALVVKQSVSAQSLLDVMAASKQNFVRNIELFDEFKPKAGSSSMADDEKSLAFRVTLLNPNETLQDPQIDAVMATLLGAVEKKCAARLR